MQKHRDVPAFAGADGRVVRNEVGFQSQPVNLPTQSTLVNLARFTNTRMHGKAHMGSRKNKHTPKHHRSQKQS